MVSSTVIFILCGLTLISAAERNVLQDFQGIKKLSILGLEVADYFRNGSLKDYPSEPTQEDLLCLQQMLAFSAALSDGQYWALKMIDSWGKYPSGLLNGNFYDLGNYDECLSVSHKVNDKAPIRGKYCFLTISPGKIPGLDNAIAEAFNIFIATCFPASCSANQMNQFIQSILNLNTSNTSISISENSCHNSEKEPWDAITVFTVVFLSLMACIVFFLTIYDYFFCQEKSELPVLVRVFSARINSQEIFRITEKNTNPNVIDCIHGIRCLSLLWVVYCHEYAVALMAANINFLNIIPWAESPYSSFMIHGFFSVDSFFFLGGLLVALISLRSMERTCGKLNIPLMYLHRLVRIFPLMAISIPIYMKIMPILADGPLFQGGYSGQEACERGWFWSLLFVQNYLKDICIGHTWYLAVDMQLFIISPILLIAIYRWGKKAAAGIFVLLILLSGCLFATHMVNGFSISTISFFNPVDQEAFRKLYYPTHTHAAPWLIGFLFGYFLHLNRGKQFRLRWLAVTAGWALCLALIFASIFALYPANQRDAAPISTLEDAAFYTLTRIAWPLALCWLVFACMQGYGGLANSFLSSPLWQPLSRLSYSAFMWHLFIQEANTMSSKTSAYFSDYQMMLNFWSNLGFNLLMSYTLYLIIEAPFAGLELFIKPKYKQQIK